MRRRLRELKKLLRRFQVLPSRRPSPPCRGCGHQSAPAAAAKPELPLTLSIKRQQRSIICKAAHASGMLRPQAPPAAPSGQLPRAPLLSSMV